MAQKPGPGGGPSPYDEDVEYARNEVDMEFDEWENTTDSFEVFIEKQIKDLPKIYQPVAFKALNAAWLKYRKAIMELRRDLDKMWDTVQSGK